jgi:putative endonuclease
VPNYSAFKGGIIRSNLLAFLGTNWKNTEHGHDSTGWHFQSQSEITRSARKSFAHAPGVTPAVHYVYVLRSVSDHGFYIGYSANLRKRFKQHVQGDSFATSYRGPWELIYYEAYVDQADSLGREKYLKSGAGRRFLKAQLAHYLRKNPIGSIGETSKT